MAKKNTLTDDQKETIFNILKVRFEENNQRHPHIEWKDVRDKLKSNPQKMTVLFEMEESGGEPDVVQYNNEESGAYCFIDCSTESPKGRRSLCYDREALDARKKNKPKNSAMDMAESMGIELLTEEEYRLLQTFGEFDKKTSSWIQTPQAIRERGGALFCDYRYGHVFTYHNGASSYYASRGFRGILKV